MGSRVAGWRQEEEAEERMMNVLAFPIFFLGPEGGPAFL
jgi:hypothetical protein